MSEEEQDIVTLRVDWHFPENVQSRYANNMLVQSGQFEFTIAFFEMQIPMLSGTPEENKARLEEMGSIKAECVSKIILSPELVPGLITALQTELEKHQSQRSNQ